MTRDGAAADLIGSLVLSFMVDGEKLAVPAESASEVIRPCALTRVPLAPPSLDGLANIRGTVLPIVRLSALLDRAHAPITPTTRIVVAAKGPAAGLIVDSVTALKPLEDERLIDFASLLARDFSGLSRGLARTSAADEARDETTIHERVLLGFGVAGRDYALPLHKAIEILRLPADLGAPHDSDAAMIGIMPFRGEILTLVSARVLLGLPDGDIDHAKARVIVTRIGKSMAGLVVDHMNAILRVPETMIDPVPPVLTRGLGEARIEAICRIDGERLVAILAPDGLFDEETAARIAATDGGPSAAAEPKTAAMENILVFHIAGERYGLPADAVEEVIRPKGRVTNVPRAPAFLAGLLNLRGQAVPVIDQRHRFGLPSASTMDRLVVVRIGQIHAALAVDAVTEMVAIATDDLAEAPQVTVEGVHIFDRVTPPGPDGKMILLIDPNNLLSEVERDMIDAMTSAPSKTECSSA